MSEQEVIDRVADLVKKETIDNDAAHDWWHVRRVWKLAKTMAKSEGVDSFIVQIGALLHDIGDYKFNDGDEKAGGRIVKEVLEPLGVSEPIIDRIVYIVDNISFRGGNEADMRSKEGMVVQDADMLDGLGAIGVARVFAFNGSKGRAIYNPEIKVRPNMTKEEYKKQDASNSTAVNHFYEKLFRLKGKMNTDSGKKIAQERHEFMEMYLKEFYAEWDGEK